MIMINVEEELISMGNVEEEMYESGKCLGRKAWVWKLLWKNCMTLGNVV